MRDLLRGARRPPAERRSMRAPVFAALLPLAALSAGCGGEAAADQDWRTFTSQREAAGEAALRVNVEYGAGELAVRPATGNTLYAVNMRYDASGFTPVAEYSDGALEVGNEGGRAVRGRGALEGHLHLDLGTRVPTDLTLQFGAGSARIELGGVPVRRLSVQTGASDSELDFSAANTIRCEHASIQAGAARLRARGLGNLNAAQLEVSGGVGEVLLDFTGAWADDMTAKVDVGVGSLTLRFPRGVGVQVVRSGALSSFDGQELVRRGNTFQSQDWESAERKLTVNLNAALGAVRVVWVDAAPAT